MRISQQITDAHLNALSTYHRARTYIKGEATVGLKKKEREKEEKEYSRSCIRAARGAQLFEGRQTRGEGRRAAKDPDEINIHEERGGEVYRAPKDASHPRVMMRLTLSFNIKHPTRILHRRRVTVNERRIIATAMPVCGTAPTLDRCALQL